jgi:hypothetical protein
MNGQGMLSFVGSFARDPTGCAIPRMCSLSFFFGRVKVVGECFLYMEQGLDPTNQPAEVELMELRTTYLSIINVNYK